MIKHVFENTAVQEVIHLFDNEYDGDNGESVFVFSIILNRKDYVEAFLRKQPELLEKIDVRGRSVLHWASQSYHVEILNFFLTKVGLLALNLKDFDGKMPLNLAAESGFYNDYEFQCPKILQLLRGGADPKCVQKDFFLLLVCGEKVFTVLYYLLVLNTAGLKLSAKLQQYLKSRFGPKYVLQLRQKIRYIQEFCIYCWVFSTKK